MLYGGSHVCVGGVGVVPDGGSIRVELDDGTSYESRAIDGCAMAFAPITSKPSPTDRVTVRYLDRDGSDELPSDTVWIGDGGPASGV